MTNKKTIYSRGVDLHISRAQAVNSNYYRVTVPTSILSQFSMSSDDCFAWDIVDSDTLILKRLKL